MAGVSFNGVRYRTTSHRKEYLDWITSAKRDETRAKKESR